MNSTSSGNWVSRLRPGPQPGHLSESAIRQAMAEDDAATLVGWWPQRILIGAALWLVGALLLFAVGLYFSRHRTATLPGDDGILALVQQIRQPLLVRFINLSSDLNWPRPAGIIVIVVTLLLVLVRRYRAAIGALIAGFIADFTGFFLLNDWVRRVRPHDVHIHAVAGIGATSYPSGHVVHVTAFYGFMLYLALREQRWHPHWTPLLRIIQVICGYFIVFIGLSRLLEDDHWPSDALAGYLLGAMMLAVAIVIYHALAVLWLRRHELLARIKSLRR